jgi:TonB family protein
MLREIPGVRIGPVTNQGRAIRLRGATCPPLVFVDGFPATAGEFDVDMIDLVTVEGIEVYSGMATVPPEFLGPRDLDRCGVIAIWSRPSRAKARPGGSAGAAPSAADTASLYMRDEVDVAARPDSGNVGPTYPDSLYRAQVRGQVVVEFVVDTLGLVELASIEVLVSSDPLFTAAVRDALARAKFVPARRGGQRARQLVQYPFVFSPSLATRP